MKDERAEAGRRKGMRLTIEGVGVLGLAILLGIAAVNSGTNLIYLLSATLFAFFFVGSTLSLISVRRIQGVRRHPARVTAGEEMIVDLSLTSRRRSLTSYSIRVREAPPADASDRWVFRIRPGETVKVSYPVTFPRRGRYRFGEVRISTLFPFGILEARAALPVRSEVIVLPPVLPFARRSRQIPAGGRVLERRSWVIGDDEEFHGVREYREGDNPRQIHWKSSAKANRMMVKDLRDRKRDRVTVLLDTAMPEGSPPSRAEDIERGIILAASILHEAFRRGRPFSLVVHVPDLTVIPPDRGRSHFYSVLECLACLEYSPREEPAALARAARGFSTDRDEVYLLSLGSPTRPASEWKVVDLTRGEDRRLLGKEGAHAAPIPV